MLTDTYDSPLLLIVEDDENHADLIRLSFEDDPERYRLETVGTLAEAAQLMERVTPDLVLTDYRLPDGDGKGLVSLVNERCPVIMMTSHGSEQVAAAIMKAGAKDYIVKSPDAFLSMPRVVKMTLREWDLVRERREAYEAVSRGKREWEQTFDAVPDLIAIIDTSHNISRVNRAVATRFGMEPERFAGSKCFEIFHGSSAPPAACPHLRTLATGREHCEELEDPHHDTCLEVTVSPLFDEKGGITACVHVARDVTERKRGERDRLRLEQQFQQTQKLESLGVLAGGIAHDFNNILMIILGHCMLAKDTLDARPAVESHFHHIEGAAHRAADLCRQMLTYAGRSPLVQTQIKMGGVVDEMVKMLKSAIKKNVAFRLDIRRDVPAVDGDKAQIQQVVMNLIMNAAEAIGDRPGGVRIAVTEVELPEKLQRDFLGAFIAGGKYACVTVSDTGCGMDEETKKRIFEPFFTTKRAGRGLGMSAVLGIIRSHKGALKLSSEVGVGTTFEVYFPLSARAPSMGAAPGAPHEWSGKRSGTVLLVDDEAELRMIGGNLLSAMGFSVITAANGLEALEIFRERGSSIDVLMIDLIMPDMGGVDTYREVRAMAEKVPVVICSGYDGEEVGSFIDRDEHAGFVAKPYAPDRLREVLHELLEKRDAA